MHSLDQSDASNWLWALRTLRYLCQCLDNGVKMGYGSHVLEYHMPRRLTSWPDAGRGWPLRLVRALASRLLSPEAGVLRPHIFIQEPSKSCKRSVGKEKEGQISVFEDFVWFCVRIPLKGAQVWKKIYGRSHVSRSKSVLLIYKFYTCKESTGITEFVNSNFHHSVFKCRTSRSSSYSSFSWCFIKWAWPAQGCPTNPWCGWYASECDLPMG